MPHLPRPIAVLLVLALALSGCDALASIAPPPAATAIPSPTPTPAPSATATPTLGPREFMDTVFCASTDVEDGSFNLVRFLSNGTVLDVQASPFGSCQEAWDSVRQHLTVENTMTFSHGEYHLSNNIVIYELAAPHSSTVVGDASGVIEGSKLTLTKLGDTVEYIQMNLGN